MVRMSQFNIANHIFYKHRNTTIQVNGNKHFSNIKNPNSVYSIDMVIITKFRQGNWFCTFNLYVITNTYGKITYA